MLNLDDPSQSRFASGCPSHPRVERDEDDWVELALDLMCIILQNVNMNTKTHGTD
jgi:hypothetical protein